MRRILRAWDPPRLRMVQLTILTGARKGERLALEQPVIRLGRSEDCDVRLDGEHDLTVSGHHAEIILEGGVHLLIDTGSTNGTSLNGRPVVKRQLHPADLLRLGGQHGVELRVDALGEAPRGRLATPDPRYATRAILGQAPPQAAAAMVRALGRGDEDTAAQMAGEAAHQVAAERAKAGGRSSGQTMGIMAAAVAAVHQRAWQRSSRRWLKVVAAVAGLGLLVAAGMGVVIWRQRQEIEALFSKKTALDHEIAQVQRAMELETEEARLAELEQRLAQLTGNAQTTIGEVALQDRSRAEALQNEGDDLELAIKGILAKFDAPTYAIPPLFRETLQREVDVLARSGNLRFDWGRRNRHWPVITEAFSRFGLPEEMAYIAWAETQFDPEKTSPAGARGMWQMTADTARELGLRVDAEVDERLDVEKQTQAAARKLASLLSVFGSDSFMLALASYNSGEAGVRRVLLQVGQEKDGFRKEKRDFWHLYRLRRLPRETMDYVPRVLAAAVDCGNPRKYGLAGPEGR